MKVFLDANVLFSASNAQSNIARLITLLIDQHEPVTSDYAAEEAHRNVQLKRPAWSEALKRLMESVRVVRSIRFDLPVDLIEKDQPILCTAIRSGCRYLVTGDQRDFGHLFDHTIEGTTISTPLRLAEIIASSEHDA